VVITALQRAILGQQAEVPFAHEGGSVSRLAQERRQGGMAWRQAGVAADKRLVETNVQAVLIASGNESGARGRADRGVGIGLQEARSA
jgi:hypothetical protein